MRRLRAAPPPPAALPRHRLAVAASSPAFLCGARLLAAAARRPSVSLLAPALSRGVASAAPPPPPPCSAVTLCADRTVRVSLFGAPAVAFHPCFLFANAPAHRDGDSSQLLLSPERIVPEGRALVRAEASPCGGALRCAWSCGARAEYAASWLRAHAQDGGALLAASRAAVPPALLASSVPPPFPYEALLRDGRDGALTASWLQALARHGLTRVRGAPAGADAVLALAALIAPPQRTIYGERFEVAVTPAPINIAYSPAHLDLHVDLAYYESPPGLQLLHAARFDAAVVGGESTFMDGLAAARDFARTARAHFDALAELPTTFQKVHYRRAVPAHVVARRPIFTVDRYATALAARQQQQQEQQHGGGGGAAEPVITGLFWAPQFEGPLALDVADSARYYAAYAAWVDFLRAREADGRHLVEYRMAEGDISVFVQRRILHGRRAIRGAGERVLHGCYVAIDEFKSRLEYTRSVHGGESFLVGNQQPC